MWVLYHILSINTSITPLLARLGIFSENGTLDPSKKTLLMWGILEGLFAIVLMIGSKDALTTMETLAIVRAFPFIFVEIGAAVGLTRGLKEDKKH
ncbi:MAG: BCCT family transporter [Mogibacterium sp.]|nr:BCCT family transporter [Mogibacterium sp.]